MRARVECAHERMHSRDRDSPEHLDERESHSGFVPEGGGRRADREVKQSVAWGADVDESECLARRGGGGDNAEGDRFEKRA